MAEQFNDANYHKIQQLETWKDKRIVMLESKHVEKIKATVPKPALLSAVRVAEKRMSQVRRQVGVFLRGVEDDGDLDDYSLRTRLGGSFEHILEHGLCSILDQYCPINEQAAGLTDWDRRGVDSIDSDEILVYIAPPPSMSKDKAERIINKSMVDIQRQYEESGKIDLLKMKLE